MRKPGLLLTGFTLLLFPAASTGQTAESVLRAAESAYRRVVTMQADFYQTIINPMLGDPASSHGVLLLAPPGKFAMRFVDPKGDRVVADGEWLWLYTPSTIDDQVIRTPIPTSGAATPNLFGQFVDRPFERYAVSYVGEGVINDENVDKVKMIPKSQDIPFREAVVYVGRTDGVLRAIDLVEESGQRRHLVFQHFRFNAPIPPNELAFKPPRGVRVVVP
jgi:outer membrane lipoprotein carrier protein